MIDDAIVRHIAHLARIGVGDAERRKLAKELGAILAYVDQLREVDVSGVEPIAHITGLVNATRSDEPAGEGEGVLVPDMNADLLEEQAPAYHNGEVRVPRVIQ